MGDDYSYVGAVVGATYPEQGKVLRKIMPKSFILVPVMVHRAEKVHDLYTSSTKTDLVAIVNSSRESLLLTNRSSMQNTVTEHFAEASRAAVEAMIADIGTALERAKKQPFSKCGDWHLQISYSRLV